MNHLGVVVIGRNEGERLRRCLSTVCRWNLTVIYVDSNSTDGSSALARTLGAEVVDLDLSRPFTAARARNIGFARLEEIDPNVCFVQFVDGDCELVDGWLAQAIQVFEERPEVAVVCGRRREQFPQQSIYNRLADLEWNTPVGEAKYCGGDAMMRVAAFRQVGGFNPDLIAGEEPELCVRLRRQGWIILRIDAEMTLHDLAMTQFRQWWRRTIRNGFAFAEGAALHGRPPERHWVHHVRSTVLWGIALPLIMIGLAWPTHGVSLLLVLGYPLQVLRVARRHHKAGMPWYDAWLYSGAYMLGRFPNAIGLLRYASNRLLGWRQSIIEYKKSTPVRIFTDQRA
jgi:GT2 family glycosyltransferase